MGYLEAIILGIVQGLTEFLPVSSSGHLELGKVLLGDTSLPKESMLFTVVVHFATALSTLVVFRRQVFGIIAGLFESGNKESWSFSGKIILSMIPAAMIGVLFADELERLFDRQVLLVGAMLLVTGFLLIAADRPSGQGRSVTMLDAMIVGLAQAFAILPGISRSGRHDFMLGLARHQKTRCGRIFVPHGRAAHTRQNREGPARWCALSLSRSARRVARWIRCRLRERAAGVSVDGYFGAKCTAEVFRVLLFHRRSISDRLPFHLHGSVEGLSLFGPPRRPET